jgi:two-component system sensor histidine kinase AlgZ
VAADDDAWEGLWYRDPPGRRRDRWIQNGIVYLLTPLALVLLFGEIESAERFGYAYLGAFIVGGCIAGIFELMYHLVWPALIHGKPGWVVRAGGHAVTLVVAVGIGAVLANVIGTALIGWKVHVTKLWLQGGVVAVVIISLLVLVDDIRGRARDLERREAALRVTTLRAELAALQARTDPHFLFNSLNTVAALIPEDPVLAESLLERLATVFRYALEAGRRDSVALADEIAAVTAYLEVEALRLGPRLRWRLDRGDGVDAVRVPPLVLQPLVENAVRHGAGGRIGSTEIVVSARRRDDEVVLAVEDRGDAAAAKVDACDGEAGASGPTAGSRARRPGAGTALADLESRLALAYGGRARLTAGAADDAGWRAEVVLPVERAA